MTQASKVLVNKVATSLNTCGNCSLLLFSRCRTDNLQSTSRLRSPKTYSPPLQTVARAACSTRKLYSRIHSHDVKLTERSNLGCEGYSSSEIWYPGLQDLNILDKGSVWNSFECIADASAQCPAAKKQADGASVEAPRNIAPGGGDTSIYLCSETDFTGECHRVVTNWGVCSM